MDGNISFTNALEDLLVLSKICVGEKLNVVASFGISGWAPECVYRWYNNESRGKTVEEIGRRIDILMSMLTIVNAKERLEYKHRRESIVDGLKRLSRTYEDQGDDETGGQLRKLEEKLVKLRN